MPSGLIATVPFDAVAAITVKGSPSGSLSLPSTSMSSRSVSTGVIAMSSTASGSVFIGASTVTVSVPVSVSAPSVTVYVIVAGPVKPGVGSKFNVPSGFSVTVPSGDVAEPRTSESVSSSGSVSLPITSMSSTSVSNGVVAVSSAATGAAFVPVTVTDNVPVSSPPLPSTTVYVMIASPTKPGAGSKLIVPSGF